MFRRILCTLTALLLASFSSARASTPPYFSRPAPCAASASVPVLNAAREELVRLHVIASDDSPDAQALKLKIRDAAAQEARILLEGCPDAPTAYARLTAALPRLEAAARARAESLGADVPIRAVTGVFPFPDRLYSGILVPAGDYRAVRIVIGEGRGKNWWCILFPTLCLPTDGHSALADWFRRTFPPEAAA